MRRTSQLGNTRLLNSTNAVSGYTAGRDYEAYKPFLMFSKCCGHPYANIEDAIADPAESLV